MGSWTNATAADTPPGVILDEAAFQTVAKRRVALPGPEAARFVERYWALSWDRPQDAPRFTSSLIPDLTVNLTDERGSGRPRTETEVVLTGATTCRFDVVLEGRARVIGIKWRPGAFTAITGADAVLLTDRTVPAADHLDADAVAAVRDAAQAPDGEQADLLEQIVLSLIPAEPPTDFEHCTRLLELVADPTVTKVDHLASKAGLSVRSVQRKFLRWIGVGPKHVLTRMRLQDASSALTRGGIQGDGGAHGQDLAALALSLGFYDQAHLTREFTRYVGVSPALYAARQLA